MRSTRQLNSVAAKIASSALRRLHDDRQGATAIEFGLLALPFLAVICAIFEIAFVDFHSALLQASLTGASRQMMTGQMQTQATPITTGSQFVTQYLCPSTGKRLLPSTFDCSKIAVDVRVASAFSVADTSNQIYKGGAKFCPGGAGQIVVMRVTYPLGAILPLNLFNRANGVVNDVPGQSGFFHILLGKAVFQAENFSGAYTPPAGC